MEGLPEGAASFAHCSPSHYGYHFAERAVASEQLLDGQKSFALFLRLLLPAAARCLTLHNEYYGAIAARFSSTTNMLYRIRHYEQYKYVTLAACCSSSIIVRKALLNACMLETACQACVVLCSLALELRTNVDGILVIELNN